jgi:hypothetical protein
MRIVSASSTLCCTHGINYRLYSSLFSLYNIPFLTHSHTEMSAHTAITATVAALGETGSTANAAAYALGFAAAAAKDPSLTGVPPVELSVGRRSNRSSQRVFCCPFYLQSGTARNS